MEFRILGLLEAAHGGRGVELPAAAKVRAVLGMLLVHPNQVVPVDRLADGLWGDDEPSSALNVLQGYVSRLRKCLGAEGIQTRAAGYVLVVDPECVDAARFERLTKEGQRARAQDDPGRAADLLGEALALWRGEPLADFTYAEWAQADIARLGELRLTAVEERLEARLDLGHHDQVLGELDALVVAHPLRERLWAARMLALYRVGRQADALRSFQGLRTRLGDELGIEPSAELVALEAAVLRQDASLQWRPPPAASRLPAPRSTFVGRDQELREVEKLVAETGMVTVVGLGGVGKTRLAIEVARRMSTGYEDVRLVELAPLTDPSLVVPEVAATCGVREEPGRTLLDSLSAALASRRLLLVLDNCEHLLDATARLADTLLRAAPSVAVLATSREPLRIDGERVWRIAPLPVPPADGVSAEAAMASDAVRLFADRATDADSGFTVTRENVAAVVAICRRLDGIPLALELAAARIPALTPTQIAARLGDRFRLLHSGARTAPARQQTLAATVQWSYDLCLPPEQVLFRRLSVFAGGFTLEAVEAVCTDQALPAEGALDALTGLVDRSLVVVQPVGDVARYHLPETIRAYAEERLAEAGEDRAVRDAHLAWVVGLSESAARALAPAVVARTVTLQNIEVVHDNIRKALGWAVSVDADAALSIVAAMGPFWAMRGFVDEAGHWSQAVLASASKGSRVKRAAVLRSAGGLAIVQGDVPRGRAHIEQAMSIFRELGDNKSVASILSGLSHTAVEYDQDYEGAERLAQDSVAISSHEGEEHLASEAKSWLAMVRLLRGDETTAGRLVKEALAFNRHGEDPCPIITTRAGTYALLVGNRKDARYFLGQALSHVRERGLRPLLVSFFGSPLPRIGELALLEGDLDEAERCFAEQLDIARELRAWRGLRRGSLGLAKVALRRGHLARARAGLDEIHRMTRALRDVADPAYLDVGVALVAAEQRLENAARLLGAAEAHREAIGAPVPAAYRAEWDALRSEITAGLAPDAFAASCSAGRRLPADVALEQAAAS